jgi:hypothetical protein
MEVSLYSLAMSQVISAACAEMGLRTTGLKANAAAANTVFSLLIMIFPILSEVIGLPGSSGTGPRLVVPNGHSLLLNFSCTNQRRQHLPVRNYADIGEGTLSVTIYR